MVIKIPRFSLIKEMEVTIENVERNLKKHYDLLFCKLGLIGSSLRFSNTPAKSAPNGHEMCGISEFYWFQPRKPQPLNWLVQIYCFANSGKIRIWAMRAKYKTKSKTHGAYMSHGMVAILWTAIPCMFYEFFTKTVERKQPRISHNFRKIVKIANAIQ